jgi:hypothetical protein
MRPAGSEGLSEVLRPVPNHSAEDEPEHGRAEDDCEQDQPELEAAEPEEQTHPFS